VNAFGMNTYAYASNYTMPNTLSPGGGLLYGRCGAGVPGQISTNNFPLAPLSLTTGTGITTAQIDSGLASYDFRAQFSTYLSQGDYAQVSIHLQKCRERRSRQFHHFGRRRFYGGAGVGTVRKLYGCKGMGTKRDARRCPFGSTYARRNSQRHESGGRYGY
jgi:hypothetical protein